MRQQGKSLGYCLDNSPYKTTFEVIQAIKAFNAEIGYARSESREEALQAEIDRLDAVQADAWEIMTETHYKYSKDGHELGVDHDARFKAHKTILDCIKQRSTLKGLTDTDVSTAKAAVLIIGGNEADFIRGLQGTIPLKVNDSAD